MFVVSALARVEVESAIWHKHRQDALPGAHASLLVGAFAADCDDPDGSFVDVGIGPRVLLADAELTGTPGLRAYDAVQVSCALAARTADPDVDAFLCFDVELRTAASRAGFSLVA